jgi:8-oxo-dGTP pyrophosphatase MutT (NUDIX family)
MKSSPTCTFTTGWFLATHYADLRKHIVQIVDARVTAFEKLDSTMFSQATEGLLSGVNATDGSSSASSSASASAQTQPSSSSSSLHVRSAALAPLLSDSDENTAEAVRLHLQWTDRLSTLEKRFASADEMHLDALVEERRMSRQRVRNSKISKAIVRSAIREAKEELGIPVRGPYRTQAQSQPQSSTSTRGRKRRVSAAASGDQSASKRTLKGSEAEIERTQVR